MTRSARWYVLVIVCTPGFFGYIGLNKGQCLYLGIVFLYSFSVILSDWKKCRIMFSSKIESFLVLFLFLSLIYATSALLNFRRNDYSGGDIIEILRPSIYFMSLISSVLILQKSIQENGSQVVLEYFEKTVFVISVLEFIKFLPPAFSFFKLYTVFPFGSINYIRLSGTTGFAYSWAWICIICLFLTVSKTRRIKFKFFWYSIVVFMTGSRTGILALPFCWFLIFIHFKKTRLPLIFCISFIILVIVFLYFINVEIVVTSVDYIIRLVKVILLGEGKDGSFNTRNRQKMIAMEYFNSSPLFGVASNKAEHIIIENFYFHHLQNWGLIGLVFYILILLSFYILGNNKNRSVIFAILSISFIICFSTPLFDQIRIFSILYLLFASFLIKKETAP